MNLRASRTYIEDLERAGQAVAGLERLRGRRVLVTGATGTIGSFVTDLLCHIGQGTEVYAMGRSMKRLEERFGNTGRPVLVEHDVNSPVKPDFPVDFVIHAAGTAYPSLLAKDPAGTLLGFVQSTYHMLEYARSSGAQRLLYVSSAEVYGLGPGSPGEYREDLAGALDPSVPRNCYPVGKIAAENLCASYSAMYPIETVSVRPCYIYGPAFSGGDNRASVQFLLSAFKGEDIIMYSKGLQMRSYCYAADCASGILSALCKGKSGEAYNIASRESKVTVAGFARIAASSAGKSVLFRLPGGSELSGMAKPRDSVLDPGKLEALGWKGQFTAEEGIAHTLKILKEAGFPC